MKQLFFVLAILYCHTAIAQQREQIRGTKYTIEPPAGFVPAINFNGFQTSSGASILLAELPAPVLKMVESFTTEALATKGMSLIEKKEVAAGLSNTTLFKVAQMANGTQYVKYILVGGDTANTIIINGTYPVSDADVDDDILKALLSVRQDMAAKPDKLGSVKFTVGVTDGYELLSNVNVPGGLLYVKEHSKRGDKPYFVVSNSVSDLIIADRKDYAINRLKSLPDGDSYKIKDVASITVDGMEGYEILADKEDGVLYEMMVFEEEGGYYLFVGEALPGKEGDVAIFKKIARTVKRK